MPLTVQQLNADTTFLLTFTIPSPSTTTNEKQSCADYTILIDPWLTGPSPIFHASFAVSSHKTESAIQSLAELNKPPDLVIVSQPKNDHCNKETLSTLHKSWRGTIVAVPAAAKKIRSWKQFDDNQIRVVPAYNSKNAATLVRLPLGLTSNNEATGEITIANIPEPYDLSAVHNAIGITYQPPPSSTPPTKPLSILYTPHGISSSLLSPYYLTNHLRPPLDLLFHSLNNETNPKLLGGVVANGAPGGVAMAKMVGAKNWIAAHDEEKVIGGIATKLIRCRVFGLEEVEGMLEKEGIKGCRVRRLGVGGVLEIEGGERSVSGGEKGGGEG